MFRSRSGKPAVAQLVVRGAGAHAIAGGIVPAAGAQPLVQLDAIVGTGSLRIDPAVPVTGAVVASLQVTITPNARLTSNVPALGGVAAATCTAAIGSLVVVALEEPAPASSLPGLTDPLWIGAANWVVNWPPVHDGSHGIGMPCGPAPARTRSELGISAHGPHGTARAAPIRRSRRRRGSSRGAVEQATH